MPIEQYFVANCRSYLTYLPAPDEPRGTAEWTRNLPSPGPLFRCLTHGDSPPLIGQVGKRLASALPEFST